MFLVLHNSYDSSAVWAYRGLKAKGLNPIELVDAQSIVNSPDFEHRIADEVSTRITLLDGRVLDSRKTTGVLNRLQSIPTSQLKGNKTDNLYALQELTACFISWLHSLPQPVLNPATPMGLSGEYRHASQWAILAYSAGLKTLDYEQNSYNDKKAGYSWLGRLVPPKTPTKKVFVINSSVVGKDLPVNVAEGCRCLGRLSRTPLLGLEFLENATDPWVFAGATPFPNLTLGGEGLLDGLAHALRGKEGHL